MTKATKRVIIVAVAFVVMAAIVLGMVAALTNGGTGENKVTENGGMIMGESDGNGVALTSSVIAPEDYAANGVSALAESAYTVTATITPSNAVDKTVDWSVSWANAESEFATGKTVTDYVTVTPESDGALTATVECKQAFGEQIILTVVSSNYSDIFANCTIDYCKKIDKASVSFEEIGGWPPTVFNVETENYMFNFKVSGGYNLSFNPEFSIGTIEDTSISPIDAKFYLQYSSEFIEKLKSENIELIDNALERQEITIYESTYYAGREIIDKNFIYPGDDEAMYLKLEKKSGLGYEKIIDILYQMQGRTVCTLIVDYVGDYLNYQHEINLQYKPELYEVQIESVSLSNSSIVF